MNRAPTLGGATVKLAFPFVGARLPSLRKTISQTHVIPAQAGIQVLDIVLDSRLRGKDRFLLLVNIFKIKALSIDTKKVRAALLPGLLYLYFRST